MNSRRTLFALITLLLVFAVLEVSSYVGGRLLQSKWAMWQTPRAPAGAQTKLTFDEYMERRDPVLGWPYPSEYGDNLDPNGSQLNPHYPSGDRPPACLSLYGDSFTEGGDISERARSWSNVLSKSLGCYVANFGMGGYGTDQALIRFMENTNDPAPRVVFGLHTGDTLRNLTRIRDLENYAMWYALKPRFIMGASGEIELVPIPDLSEDQYRRILTVEGEQEILEHETLHPGGPAGVVKLEFPYSVAVVKNLLGFHGFRSRLFRYPEWTDFLQPDHPLEGLDIMVGINRKFVELARARGKEALIVILPHPSDLDYFTTRGEWPYQHVLSRFETLALPYADFGPHLLATSENEGVPLASYFGPTGHYNDTGNAELAGFVESLLAQPAGSERVDGRRSAQ